VEEVVLSCGMVEFGGSGKMEGNGLKIGTGNNNMHALPIFMCLHLFIMNMDVQATK
jgi:hypothetical protein